MLVVINDLSFDGQFEEVSEARSALINLAQMYNNPKFKSLTGKSILFAESNLKDRLITKSKTIHTMIVEMDPKKNIEFFDIKATLIQLFIQNTKIIEEHEKKIPVNLGGNQLEHTCVNFAFDQKIHHALLSCSNSPSYSQQVIQVESEGSHFSTLNFITNEDINNIAWINIPNEKKHVKKDVSYGKNTASRMDLIDDEAQYALSNSVRLPNDGSCLYLKDKQWYKFNFESQNIAHGFCEDTPEKQTNFSLVQKVFGELQDQRIGQIISEYTKFSP
jgi:hypothetical protein